ncbi:MAG: S8 family peptidase [Vicinamibacterales bacterium]
MMSWFARSSTVGRVLLATLAAALVLAVPVATQTPRQRGDRTVVNGRPAAAGEVLVKFRTPVAGVERQRLGTQMDADEDHDVGSAGVRRIHSRVFDTETLLAFLRTDPRVLYAEPNYIVQAVATPNDPQFSSQNLWGLQNLGLAIGCSPSCYGSSTGSAGADIEAPLAWDVSTGSRAIVTGVVDTGIDYTHPDLAANVWSAPSAFSVTIAGKIVNCAAGTHGFKSINNSLTLTCDPLDDNNHGSHVSGTIGGVGNNGVGGVGVNWTASIMGLKFLDANGSGYLADAINVLKFAMQAKSVFGSAANVRVLSNSWGGGGFSQALLDEINNANANDMLFVAAAGNNGANNDTSAFYPANYVAPNVVSVAATTNTDQMASFSNYGATKVHIGAPGQDVRSTIRNGGYAYFSGTSMATPHVSGAAALLLSACTLNTAALRSTILGNVDPTLTGWVSSGGRLNVNTAIRACSAPPSPDFSVSATPASRTVVQGAGTSYTATVTPTGGFSGAVALSASGLPSGASFGFSPASLTSGSSTMTVTTASTTPPGTYQVPITGTGPGGTPVHTQTVTLVVTAAPVPNFTLSASPSTRSVRRGRNTTYTVSISRSGGFTGSVTLSLGGLPTGATASFSPNPASGSSSTLTVQTASSTPTGSRTLTITGVNGSLTRTSSVALTVRN